MADSKLARRSFIQGLAVLVAAPAIIKYDNLMPIKRLLVPSVPEWHYISGILKVPDLKGNWVDIDIPILPLPKEIGSFSAWVKCKEEEVAKAIAITRHMATDALADQSLVHVTSNLALEFGPGVEAADDLNLWLNSRDDVGPVSSEITYADGMRAKV